MPNNATATRRTAPLAPRRVSGPVRRPVPVGPPSRGRTGAFERLARIPDHRLIDRLLRSRLCIWVIGIMLGGIVFMQVSLLRMNTGISRAVAAQTTYERQNANLRAEIAEKSSGDIIRDGAVKAGMIDPPAGNTRFLTSRDSDITRAVRRMKPPSERAISVMEHHGMLPAAIIPAATADPAAVTQVSATPTPVPQASAAAIQTPVPTVNALPTPGATPVPTTTPVAPAAQTPVPTVAPLG
jgi:hypothetical protein